MNRTRAVSVPGRDIALTVSLGGAAAGCEPEITGLFWFSDASGAFDAEAEAAYLLPEGGAGPTIAAAKLLGETCGANITWATSWTPQDVGGGAPGIWSDGPDLIVYPLETTTPGILDVSAECAGQTYGPILLSVLRYTCYTYYTYGTSALGWWRIADSSGRVSFSGYSNPIGESAGITDIDITVADGAEYPVGFYLDIQFPSGSADAIVVTDFTCATFQLLASDSVSARFAVSVDSTPTISTLEISFTDIDSVVTTLTATITIA